MNCDKCGNERIISISAKCDDLFSLNYKGREESCIYVPEDIGVGDGGSYVEFSYCLECGKIQGTFPLPDPKPSNEDEEDEL